jgi:hypothetical protein
MSNYPNPKVPKTPKTFTCEICDYLTSNKKDYKKHEETIKHKTKLNPNESQIKKPPPVYQCKCGKIYKHAPTLSNHKKKCNYKESKPTPAQYIKDDPNAPEMSFLTNLVIEVVKNNSELQKQNQEYQKQMIEMQKQMLEVCKGGIKNTSVVHTNSHNKTFNLQFFLNETCKDAMNLVDFVNTMSLELSDLEDVGKLGYVEGISNIIIRKLNALDVHKRPIHCSDAKREIMYVKDQNIWEKENGNYDKLRKAIKSVTYKNSALLVPWSQEHPQCMNNQHHLNDVYVQMMGQAMGGRESFLESENKIMKKIAKAVLIEKT